MLNEQIICELCGYAKGKSEPDEIDTVDRNYEHTTKFILCPCTDDLDEDELEYLKHRIMR